MGCAAAVCISVAITTGMLSREERAAGEVQREDPLCAHGASHRARTQSPNRARLVRAVSHGCEGAFACLFHHDEKRLVLEESCAPMRIPLRVRSEVRVRNLRLPAERAAATYPGCAMSCYSLLLFLAGGSACA